MILTPTYVETEASRGESLTSVTGQTSDSAGIQSRVSSSPLCSPIRPEYLELPHRGLLLSYSRSIFSPELRSSLTACPPRSVLG